MIYRGYFEITNGFDLYSVCKALEVPTETLAKQSLEGMFEVFVENVIDEKVHASRRVGHKVTEYNEIISSVDVIICFQFEYKAVEHFGKVAQEEYGANANDHYGHASFHVSVETFQVRL